MNKRSKFFCFPKHPVRCKVWIAKIDRPELKEKSNIQEYRNCEKHFEPSMLSYGDRLQSNAMLILCLDATHPPPPPAHYSANQLKIEGTHLVLKNSFEQPVLKRMKMDNEKEDSLEIMQSAVSNERGERKKYCIAPKKVYLDACKEIRETGITFRKAAQKYNVNYSTLLNFSRRLRKSINGLDSIPQQSNQTQTDVTIQPINQSHLKRSSTALITPQMSSQIASHVLRKAFRPKIQPVPRSIPNQTSAATSMTANANNWTSTSGYKHQEQIFSVEQENELANFVRDTSNYYNGMSSRDVCILAYVYGVCNQVNFPVGWQKRHQASFDWCLEFIKRNKLISMMIGTHKFRNT